MENEFDSPIAFLSIWGRAFLLCLKEAKSEEMRGKFRRMVNTCSDAIWRLRNEPNRICFHTDDAIVAALQEFISHFQKEVIEAGGNAHEANRRIVMIQKAIAEIKPAQAQIVQGSLF